MATPPGLSRSREEPKPDRPALDAAPTWPSSGRDWPERTLMAWIRTSLSMISFGFTTFKFFQYIEESPGAFGASRPHGALNLGRVMVVLGVLLLALAVVQHWLFLRGLGQRANRKFPVSLALIGAGLIGLIGLGALLSVFLRVGPF
jgi:inner membrane protein YidH